MKIKVLLRLVDCQAHNDWMSMMRQLSLHYDQKNLKPATGYKPDGMYVVCHNKVWNRVRLLRVLGECSVEVELFDLCRVAKVEASD